MKSTELIDLCKRFFSVSIGLGIAPQIIADQLAVGQHEVLNTNIDGFICNYS